MKVTHEMTREAGSFDGFEYVGGKLAFCASEFSFYFKFGRRKTVFFIVADRKPRHGEAFKLTHGKGKCWYFADINEKDNPEEDRSPWPFELDRYLTEIFSYHPVWIWVEYE